MAVLRALLPCFTDQAGNEFADDGKPKLIQSLGAFRGFNPDAMNRAMPAAFHPGSLKYYKEKGIAR